MFGDDHCRKARSYEAGGPPAGPRVAGATTFAGPRLAGATTFAGANAFGDVFGRLEGGAGGTAGARPFAVDGAGGYVIGTGGTNGSFGAFASIAARSDVGGGRLGEIGLSGELILSELPPTIASGAGVRDGASGDVPGFRFSAPNGDVMLFVEGTMGATAGGEPSISVGGRLGTPIASAAAVGTSWLSLIPAAGAALARRRGESVPKRCVSGAPPPSEGLLGGGGGAGAPVSRWRCSCASACTGSAGGIGADTPRPLAVSAASRPTIDG